MPRTKRTKADSLDRVVDLPAKRAEKAKKQFANTGHTNTATQTKRVRVATHTTVDAIPSSISPVIWIVDAQIGLSLLSPDEQRRFQAYVQHRSEQRASYAMKKAG